MVGVAVRRVLRRPGPRDAAHPGRADRRGDLGVRRHPDGGRDRLPDPRPPHRGGPAARQPTRRDVDQQIRAEAQQIAYALDPHAIVDRAAKAEKDRRVTSSPAPDTMMNIHALLPVVEGAAVMAALTRAADASRAARRPAHPRPADGRHPRRTGHRTDRRGADPGRDPADHDRGHPVRRRPHPGLDDRLRTDPGRLHPDPAATARRPTPRTWIRRVFTDPVHRADLRDGHPPAAVHRHAAPGADHPRPMVPHPVVRSTDPARRPRRSPSTTAARPPRPTAKACARPATTPSKPPAGDSAAPAIAAPPDHRRSDQPRRPALDELA